ncbi:carboxyl-terminal-processing peptidase 2, chloroplastic-like isoform X3 [Macadamia integrifolia]|uniref:carboxyl-terminal-processing peptidase 2, chloroplastic-like isoform X3 n=1 Tax=Macadamia integrifolia TaxID=60698 RepID=UPI001C4EEF7A|nr:carboxyl-terminal-processing peptidase 2, chloroplastic-like isoform X3 [Macadamia integrifolia]
MFTYVTGNHIWLCIYMCSLQVLPWRSMTSKIVMRNIGAHYNVYEVVCISTQVITTHENFEVLQKFHKRLLFRCGPICLSCGHHLKSDRSIVCLHKIIRWHEKFKHYASVIFVRLVIGMLVTTVSISVSKTPSWALTEENLLFLEAWRTIDWAYVEKNFNSQSWFRYQENGLRNEPMNTREETYAAVRKMLATLDDPFTLFLEPDKFKSVGLSIGYPTKFDGSTGLLVISSSPGGPANRAGIMSGDFILAIDETSTETMGLYAAAERLQ